MNLQVFPLEMWKSSRSNWNGKLPRWDLNILHGWTLPQQMPHDEYKRMDFSLSCLNMLELFMYFLCTVQLCLCVHYFYSTIHMICFLVCVCASGRKHVILSCLCFWVACGCSDTDIWWIKMFIVFTAIWSRIVSNFKLMFQLPIIRPLNSEKEPVEKLLACSCPAHLLYVHIRTVPCFVSNMCFIADVDVFCFYFSQNLTRPCLCASDGIRPGKAILKPRNSRWSSDLKTNQLINQPIKHINKKHFNFEL